MAMMKHLGIIQNQRLSYKCLHTMEIICKLPNQDTPIVQSKMKVNILLNHNLLYI